MFSYSFHLVLFLDFVGNRSRFECSPIYFRTTESSKEVTAIPWQFSLFKSFTTSNLLSTLFLT